MPEKKKIKRMVKSVTPLEEAKATAEAMKKLNSMPRFARYQEEPKPKGYDGTQFGRGNIDLYSRPVVRNFDGSISTVRSMSFNEDGKEVLVPTVINGKVVSNEEAIDHYRKTGEHLGKFDSIDEANSYAESLHDEQAKRYASAENENPSAQEPTPNPMENYQNAARMAETKKSPAEK